MNPSAIPSSVYLSRPAGCRARLSSLVRFIPLTALSLALLAPLRGESHSYKAEVMLLVKENVDRKTTSKHEAKQSISLDLSLNGKAREPETRSVKWTLYGRDATSNGVVPIEAGEIPLDLGPDSSQKVTTKEVTTSYSERYAQVSRSGYGRGRRTSVKEIPGTGVKYYGYAVQVFNGDEVVGEKFDPKTLEGRK